MIKQESCIECIFKRASYMLSCAHTQHTQAHAANQCQRELNEVINDVNRFENRYQV